MDTLLDQLNADGFVTVPDVVPLSHIAHLIDELSIDTNDDATRKRQGKAFARRNLLKQPSVMALANSPELRAIVHPILGNNAFPVRSIFFDKTPDANWVVPWHQDLSIAVKEKLDVEGFGPWSVKAGVTHVQPPLGVLKRMVTLRIHLDDCYADNGPLRVIPGSHQRILTGDEILAWAAKAEEMACHVRVGGIVVMRPTIIHASSPATSPRHRRVVHIEYADTQLPNGLQWHVE